MDPNIVGEEHYTVARGVQKILQVCESLKAWVRETVGGGGLLCSVSPITLSYLRAYLPRCSGDDVVKSVFHLRVYCVM